MARNFLLALAVAAATSEALHLRGDEKADGMTSQGTLGPDAVPDAVPDADSDAVAAPVAATVADTDVKSDHEEEPYMGPREIWVKSQGKFQRLKKWSITQEEGNRRLMEMEKELNVESPAGDKIVIDWERVQKIIAAKKEKAAVAKKAEAAKKAEVAKTADEEQVQIDTRTPKSNRKLFGILARKPKKSSTSEQPGTGEKQITDGQAAVTEAEEKQITDGQAEEKQITDGQAAVTEAEEKQITDGQTAVTDARDEIKKTLGRDTATALVNEVVGQLAGQGTSPEELKAAMSDLETIAKEAAVNQ